VGARGRAGLELALLTGMRLQEWSTVLLPELGEGVRRPDQPAEFALRALAAYNVSALGPDGRRVMPQRGEYRPVLRSSDLPAPRRLMIHGLDQLTQHALDE